MKNKTPLIVAGLVVFMFVFLFIVYKLTNVTADYTEVMTIKENDHVKWAPEKKHVLVEYSDFQCPACGAFNELLSSFEASNSANADIPKKVTLVFRHFPLYQIHENAKETAYAVEAAGKQGKFFEMADLVFKEQASLTDNPNTAAFLSEKARQAGLDIDQFNKDRASDEVKNKVNADLAQGERAGIKATPTFFLDGKKLTITSAQDFIRTLKELN